MPSGTWTIPAPARPRDPPIQDRLLTVPEVAETCQLSEKAIRRAIDRGQLKAFKLCSRLRISQEVMRAWIASQRQPILTREHTRPAGTTPRHPASHRRHTVRRQLPRDDPGRQRPRGRNRVSVEKVQRTSDHVWRVRRRDEQGQPHSHVVGRKVDALAFDEELKRAKRLGNVIPINNDDQGETVEEFAKTWWNRYVIPSLSRHTQLNYASMLDVHIIPAIGKVPLEQVTTETIWQLRADMAKAGVGDAATRKTLVTLQSMLQRAVEWNRIDGNPAKLVRKPSQTRTRVIRPLPPLDVEKIRKALLDDDLQLDATLVAVLATPACAPARRAGCAGTTSASARSSWSARSRSES